MPAAERAHAAVIAAAYSQYSALEIYGRNLPTQAQGGAITVCSSAGADWTALWPKLKIVE
jgi:hypothetical protein